MGFLWKRTCLFITPPPPQSCQIRNVQLLSSLLVFLPSVSWYRADGRERDGASSNKGDRSVGLFYCIFVQPMCTATVSDMPGQAIYVHTRRYNPVLLWALNTIALYSVGIRMRDPGSGAFMTLDPGSGMGKKSGSGMSNPDHISGSLETIFWLKYLNSVMQIRDPGWKKSGSGMEKIRIHIHWPYRTCHSKHQTNVSIYSSMHHSHNLIFWHKSTKKSLCETFTRKKRAKN